MAHQFEFNSGNQKIVNGSFFSSENYYNPVFEKKKVKKTPKKTKKNPNISCFKNFGPRKYPPHTGGWRKCSNHMQSIRVGGKHVMFENAQFLTPSGANLRKWCLKSMRSDKYFIYINEKNNYRFIVQWIDDLDEYNFFVNKLNEMCRRK
jgi:hypothetical protein